MSEGISAIIDIGSETTKVGFTSDGDPISVFPTIVGHLKANNEPKYIGDDALERLAIANMHCPLKKGHIENWTDLEKILDYSFQNVLKIDPSKYPVVLTEPPSYSIYDRSRISELMFETFNVPAFYLGNQGRFSLFSHGKATGITLEIGHEVSQIVPVNESQILYYAMSQQDIAGKDLDCQLEKLFNEKNQFFNGYREKREITKIKEKNCYVSLDFENENRKWSSYDDTDITFENQEREKTEIKMGNEKIVCPEMLFNPDQVGSYDKGIHKVLYETITKCEEEIQSQLFENIVLSGGTTFLKGFTERFKMEFTKLASSGTNINIIPNEKKTYSAFLGAVLFSQLCTYPDSVVYKMEYDEYGERFINYKCF